MDLPNKSDTGPQPSQQKVIKPVVSGAVPVQRPATRRFMDYVFTESPKETIVRVGRDVVMLRAKQGFEEAFTSFMHGLLWGGGSRPMPGVVQGTVLRGGGINYQQYSSPNQPALQAALAAAAQPTGANGAYQDLSLPTQQAAEFLLANMIDLHNQYRVVTVGDFLELAGRTPPPGSSAYGWTSLDSARITKGREGFTLELPRPTLI